MKKIVFLFLFILLPFAAELFASPPAVTEEDSLSGKISLGTLFIHKANNLDPGGSKTYINDLNSAADRELTTIPFILPNITYTIGNPNGTKLFLNSESPIDEAGGFAINIGATSPLGKAGTLKAGVYYTPFEELWKNPYATGVAREETSNTKYGTQIGLKRIMGSGLAVNLVYMRDLVDDDIIGSLERDLAREGAIYSIDTSYSLFESRSFSLKPQLSVLKGEYDGESSSFIKYKLTLGGRYTTGQLSIMPKLHYSYSEYDKQDPVFDVTREIDSYGVKILASYDRLLGFKEWSLQGIVSMSKGNDTIDFYDTESISSGIFLSYAL